MTRTGLAYGIGLLIALAGCADLVAPKYPAAGRALVHLPIQYGTWWKMTEACSGLHGNLDAVSWYTVPVDSLGSFEFEGSEDYGIWFEDGNRIYLAADAVDNGRTVRHEMLHALLRSGGHPIEYFVTRCGALAPCGPACGLSETTRGVPADAPQIPSESLSVNMSLAPAGAPAESIDSGWVTITITATNARPEPVWVAADPSFGYVFAHTPGTYAGANGPRWAFLAGESRSLAFDIQLPATWTPDTLWGFFGHAFSAPYVVSMGP